MDDDAKWYSSLGTRYEDAFGHDPGLGAFLAKALVYFPPQSRVLDIGCGTGKPVAAAVAAAGHSVTGIDISDVMVALSQKAVPNGHFEVADMRTYEPPKGTLFDVVLSILSLFVLNREDIEGMAPRWNSWLPVGGILLIGTVAAEDLKPEVNGQGFDSDGRCARDVRFRFMGADIKMTLLTRLGWEKLFEETGFEIVETMTDMFVPPKESDCDDEEHYFILARKVR